MKRHKLTKAETGRAEAIADPALSLSCPGSPLTLNESQRERAFSWSISVDTQHLGPHPKGWSPKR